MNPQCCESTFKPTIQVRDLSAKHIGKYVRITNVENRHTDVIKGLEFLENGYTMREVGRVTHVAVEFSDGSKIVYPLSATVEVL